MAKKAHDEKVDVDFESHPPIEDDLNGITTLLKQTLLQFVDCHNLAQYLIKKKDLTQVIAQSVEEEGSSSEDDEPDDNIYGVSSVIDLPFSEDGEVALDSRQQLLKFICDKCPDFKKIQDKCQERGQRIKVGMLVNERYINLPPQLSLPIFKTLTGAIDRLDYTHLVFISKVLLTSRNTDTKLPSKKSKSSTSQNIEPIVFINPEEEVVCEHSDCHTDIDVSAHCDENATWSFTSDVKYVPHRRIIVINYENWPKILNSLERELNKE